MEWYAAFYNDLKEQDKQSLCFIFSLQITVGELIFHEVTKFDFFFQFVRW